ncbi:MAG: response regulator [Actinobacteria bacterium]|nr:response regulator [Actinomycetota bacterium]
MARILLVEDSELILRVMKETLQAEGHEVIEARDGEIALRKFLEERPDLVITDCLIPKLNGFKLVQSIRELDDGGHTPIIMNSSIYRKANYRQIALDAGADIYLVKPSTPEERKEFLHKVEDVLRSFAGSVNP